METAFCQPQDLVGRFSPAAAISASLCQRSSIVCGSKSEAAADDNDGDAAIDSIPDDEWSFRSPTHDRGGDLYQKAPLAPADA